MNNIFAVNYSYMHDAYMVLQITRLPTCNYLHTFTVFYLKKDGKSEKHVNNEILKHTQRNMMMPKLNSKHLCSHNPGQNIWHKVKRKTIKLGKTSKM